MMILFIIMAVIIFLYSGASYHIVPQGSHQIQATRHTEILPVALSGFDSSHQGPCLCPHYTGIPSERCFSSLHTIPTTCWSCHKLSVSYCFLSFISQCPIWHLYILGSVSKVISMSCHFQGGVYFLSLC